MADLSTNYMDDILAESMNGKRKYRITRADGSFEEVTLEDISEYEQRGSVFGAGDINRTNQAVNEKFDSGDVVDPMETTVPGFAADALAVKNHFNEQNKNLVNFTKLLWTNPNPTSEMESIVVWNGDVTEYDYFEIHCKIKTSDYDIISGTLLSGLYTKVFYPGNFEENLQMHIFGREFWCDSRGICCAQGKGQSFIEKSGYTANNVIVPIRIYGVKLPK